MAQILGPQFYRKNTTDTVARRLLGCVLVHEVNGQRLSGRIVETEAYMGVDDRACHTFGGRQTERVKSMYLEGGLAYVYLIYGLHCCFNVVTRDTSCPEAVLIRAIEPLDGIDEMRLRRGKVKERDLANGPGKLCQAMGIDRSCDGLSLAGPTLFIERGPVIVPEKIKTTPRVGVDYAGEAATWLLRFCLTP